MTKFGSPTPICVTDASGNFTNAVGINETVVVTPDGIGVFPVNIVSGSVTVTGTISSSVTNAGTFATQDSNLASCISGSKVAISLASTTITGNVSVTQGTSPRVVQDSVAESYLQTLASTVVVSGSPAHQSIDVANAGTFGVQATQTGTWTVQQGTPPWSVTFPSPQAVTLASTTITGSVAVTGSFYPAIQPVSISSDDGTALSTSQFGTAPPPAGSPPGAQALATNASLFVGSAAVSASNPVSVGTQYNTVAPALSNTQTVVRQCDSYGNMFVNNLRRSQAVAATGSVTSTTVVTLVASQGAGVFTDLASLVLSVREGSLVNVFFGVLISDGTQTYRFNFMSQDVTTQTPSSPFCMTFDPPLGATNAATPWTIKLSTNSGQGSPPVVDAVTVDYVVNFVKQGAE